MAEWSKAEVLKTASPATLRGRRSEASTSYSFVVDEKKVVGELKD
jgi:hypothetical protein